MLPLDAENDGVNMTVAEFAKTRPFGFITEGDIPELIEINRLCLVLVRC